MDLSELVVCSFYTADEYYRGHAATLSKNLDRLGVGQDLQEIEKAPGEEWPDICRKKIPFLASVCERNPDKKVFWIDVDCQLLDLPEVVADFSADLIGFQRGFGSPLGIGYRNRTRFWEPCFFGINTSAAGRKFIRDAAQLESQSEVRATDDYFFEESWRSNAHRLSFQLVPSICVVSKAEGNSDDLPAFFSFGASGHVAEFKDKVVQHDHLHATGAAQISLAERVRLAGLRSAKSLERRLPPKTSRRIRKYADRTGATQFLTGGGADAVQGAPETLAVAGSPHRKRIVDQMIMSAQRGDTPMMNEAFVRLSTSGIPSNAEILAKHVSESFACYAEPKGELVTIPLAWWPRPFPGNFGDWLSPLVLAKSTGHPVGYVSPTAKSAVPHIVAVGSIGRFVKPNSIVVGTGVSSTDLLLEKSATYVSLRGPVTAQLLADSGGPDVESFGDPGALIRRIFPVDRGSTNGRLALVRHFTHSKIPLMLPADVDEIDVLMSHPDAIADFVEQLNRYDGVVTSAMHVMIVCHSYGIPCALVSFEGFESAVHGTGVKYRDYSFGVGLTTAHEPVPIGLDLRRAGLRDRLLEEKISQEKLDEIEASIRRSAEIYLERHSELGATG